MPVKVTLFGNGVIAVVSKLKWGNTGLEWPLIQYDHCPYKKRKRNGDTYTRENTMWRWRQMEVTCLQPKNTKDCHQPVERGRGRFSLRNSTRNQPCWLLDFKNCLTNHIFFTESKLVVKWDPADSCKYYRCLAHAKILVSSSRRPRDKKQAQ